MIIKVTVVTANKPDEKLLLTFTNRRAARDFKNLCYTRSYVLSCEINHDAIKTFPNVKSAIDAVDFWAK